MKVTTAMLADAALVANGKIYVHGGGWDTIYAATLPTVQPTMALALIFRVEYSEALVNHTIRIDLLDEEENATGLPTFQQNMNVGHPPGMVPGTPIFVPQAVTMNQLPFTRVGEYHFKVSEVGGTDELASLPFRIAPLPPGLLASLGQPQAAPET